MTKKLHLRSVLIIAHLLFILIFPIAMFIYSLFEIEISILD